jgi:hypothetical protein
MLENTEGVMKKDNPEKLATLRYSLTCICPVSCVSGAASFSGLFFYIAPAVFSNMYLSCENTDGVMKKDNPEKLAT